MDISNSNRRIARNSLMLYVRMIILLLINLYSSRVVLEELGAEDFGIYNIVGGIVTMFTFLNSSMSSATSRFLTFELGKKDYRKLTEIFKASFMLHIFIALLILLISETIGLWFVNHKLVIPEAKMQVAGIVYQLSILTIIIKTIQVPFNASIISHERMNIYAFIEIVNALVILTFLFLLQSWSNHKLIIYASMLTFVAMGVLCMYIFYCKKKFIECKLKLSFNWAIMRPMLFFSGFDLYGNMGVTVRTQGINIILNMFFGTIINAASAIATQIQTAILMLSSNVAMAFRPQIIKTYASNKIDDMEKLINYSSLISVLLFSLFAVPLILELPYVLKLWLVTPPPHTIGITRIAIVACWIGTINSILMAPIHATGKIKTLSFCGGTIYLLTLPMVYVSLRIYTVPETAYVVMLIFMVILLAATCTILKHRIPNFSLSRYCFKTMMPCILSIIVVTLLAIIVRSNIEEGFLRLALVTFTYFASILAMAYFVVLKKEQRMVVLAFIIKKTNKHE